jgi:hypothetical protein
MVVRVVFCVVFAWRRCLWVFVLRCVTFSVWCLHGGVRRCLWVFVLRCVLLCGVYILVPGARWRATARAVLLAQFSWLVVCSILGCLQSVSCLLSAVSWLVVCSILACCLQYLGLLSAVSWLVVCSILAEATSSPLLARLEDQVWTRILEDWDEVRPPYRDAKGQGRSAFVGMSSQAQEGGEATAVAKALDLQRLNEAVLAATTQKYASAICSIWFMFLLLAAYHHTFMFLLLAAYHHTHLTARTAHRRCLHAGRQRTDHASSSCVHKSWSAHRKLSCSTQRSW